MKGKLKSVEVGFKLVLFVMFSCMYILAIPYPSRSKQFPQLLAIFGSVMIAVSLIKDFMGKGAEGEEIGDVDDTELRPSDKITKKLRKKRFYQAWAIILVSTSVGFLAGFLFTAFFFFAGFSLFFGKKENLFKNMIVAIVMTAVIYFLFQFVMDVPLLDGLLW